MNLLQALIANESGGRNIPNTTQGTSSGRAEGYFQITTGTWNDFGGQQFAPTPLQATPEQQAIVAARIPLKRWDPSTIARMRATGRPIDVNATLGENLRMNGETFTNFARDEKRISGPVEAAGGGFGNDAGGTAPQLYTQPAASSGPQTSTEATGQALSDIGKMQLPDTTYSNLATSLANAVGKSSSGVKHNELNLEQPPIPESPSAAPAPLPQRDTSPPMDLASLFKVGQIGQPASVDPFTGRPSIRQFS